jgi:hypothetical protein
LLSEQVSFVGQPAELVHQVFTLRHMPRIEHRNAASQSALDSQLSPSFPSPAQAPRLQTGSLDGHSSSRLHAIAGGGSGSAHTQVASSHTRPGRHSSSSVNPHDAPSGLPAMVGCASVVVARSRVSAPRTTELQAVRVSATATTGTTSAKLRLVAMIDACAADMPPGKCEKPASS